jgi:4-hydroxybenzoate polyprenyltransferase
MTSASLRAHPEGTAFPPSESQSALAVLAMVGRVHIVAIAAMGTLTFGWLFTGHFPVELALLAALDWFLVNLLNRVVDLPEDAKNGIVGTSFVARYRRTILVLGLGVLAASFLVVPFMFREARAGAWLTSLRVAYHALGIAYNWPVLPGGRRIKELYFWKNVASAVGFLLTVFGYPLAARAAGSAFPAGIGVGTVVMAGLFFFLFEISYEVLYDLRDVAGDAAEGVKTYPVVHGKALAERIVFGLAGASAAVLAIGFASGVVPWRIFVMIAAPLAQIALARRMLARTDRAVTSADCVGITWLGAALLAVYDVWVAIGLPGVA